MKKHIEYKTSGTCSRMIVLDIEDGIVTDCTIVGGCAGNTTGICSLVKGMKADEVVEKLVDDETYLQKIRNGDLIFSNNNWINVVIIKYRDGTWDVVSEPEVAEGTNLLDEIESGFDEYVARIDKLVAEGGSENESDD